MRCSKAFEFTISSKSLLCLGPSVEAEKFYEPVYTLKKYFLSGKPVLGARRELAAALILVLILLTNLQFLLLVMVSHRQKG